MKLLMWVGAYACPSPLPQVAKSAASGRTSVSSLGSDKRGKAADTKKKVVVKKIVKKKVPYLTRASGIGDTCVKGLDGRGVCVRLG